jgi:hypothetical protein
MSDQDWKRLDIQMQAFSSRLTTKVKLSTTMAMNLATTIVTEIQALSPEQKNAITSVSQVPISDRLNELKAFQSWMDQASTFRNSPAVTRAQILTQNYICFVYLPEACFRVMEKSCPSGSATRKCAQFLNTTRIRALRNAIAHANWTYRTDFEALVYWARKGDQKTDPLIRFEVEQDELDFWQKLSRCVAYATYSNL